MFKVRRVVAAGDSAAGNAFAVIVLLTLSVGIVVGFLTRLGSVLVKAFRRGYRYGSSEAFVRQK